MVLDHALCWIHAERTLNKIIPYNDKERKALQEIREQLWKLHNDLKACKAAPTEAEKQELAARFDTLFTTKTCDATLNLALKRLHANKSELLRVLERPEIPLHNNLSEQDIFASMSNGAKSVVPPAVNWDAKPETPSPASRKPVAS